MLEDTDYTSRQPLPLTVTQATLIKGNESEATCNVSICNWQCFQTPIRCSLLWVCFTHQLLDIPATLYLLYLISTAVSSTSCQPWSIQSCVQGFSSSEISYRVHLSDSTHVIATFYLVYPEPSSSLVHQGSNCVTVKRTTEYSWSLVTRGVMLMLLYCVVYQARFGACLCRSNYSTYTCEIPRTHGRQFCTMTCLLSK